MDAVLRIRFGDDKPTRRVRPPVPAHGDHGSSRDGVPPRLAYPEPGVGGGGVGGVTAPADDADEC